MKDYKLRGVMMELEGAHAHGGMLCSYLAGGHTELVVPSDSSIVRHSSSLLATASVHNPQDASIVGVQTLPNRFTDQWLGVSRLMRDAL